MVRAAMTVPRYVVGFLFSRDLDRVLLIRKNKPEWQKGRLNGVGGSIEDGEAADEAMRREFAEETGRVLAGDPWKFYGELYRDGLFHLCWFAAVDVGNVFPWDPAGEILDSPTDEHLFVCLVDEVVTAQCHTIGNVPWLVAMARQLIRLADNAGRYRIAEVG